MDGAWMRRGVSGMKEPVAGQDGEMQPREQKRMRIHASLTTKVPLPLNLPRSLSLFFTENPVGMVNLKVE